MAEIRIGTSGWHYKHWVGTVYPARWPASKMLAWYQQHFDTVEINNSFYRLPSESALNQWRSSTPPNFLFSVKGSRFLTHMKKLKDPGPGIEKFFARVDLLNAHRPPIAAPEERGTPRTRPRLASPLCASSSKRKLGPVLFQLPPNFGVNVPRLEAFLDALPHCHRYAFEFRNETWNTPEVFRLLQARNAAWCPFHLAGYQSPIAITADITYVRLHGPGGKYQGSYDDKALGAWARRIREWRDDLTAIYVYFDNDDSGYAAHNALRLRELVMD